MSKVVIQLQSQPLISCFLEDTVNCAVAVCQFITCLFKDADTDSNHRYTRGGGGGGAEGGPEEAGVEF